ncbi:hypothetical protein E5A73_17300 [Sphingomonas gei]|uniref:Uncharacterized protein n=1 Tax=Sphingomonas gei TaxID=1395960 RepID=A0A4S1X2M4_9SPHN|nr:hypothetical protein [Sphingomonas gei]TGX50179.1 hypothetical protein E5A73_17300 [Sphingomonas gei]
MSLAVALALAAASDLEGPGRFCGYAPIIDLIAGERVVTLGGGIHSGTFRWEGAFGQLDVIGIGWASPPDSAGKAKRTSKGHLLFPPRRERGRYRVALWNGRNGVAYFSTPHRLTRQQLAAIDRVDLFEEGEEPVGCKLRTIFSWE